MIVAGIDPGLTGAISHFIGGRLDEIIDMPVFDRRVDGRQLADILTFIHAEVVYLEDTHAMPKNGAIASFSLGMSTGIIIGVVQALHIPLVRVRPSTWKLPVGLRGKPKSASRGVATELYPGAADAFLRVKDDGRADAVLIGRYGVYRELHNKTAEEQDDHEEPATVSDLRRHRAHHPSGAVDRTGP